MSKNTKETAEVAVINNSTKLFLQLYTDIAQPSFKKVGLALANAIDIIVTPLDIVHGKKNLYLANSLKKYQKKLENIDKKKIQTIEPEISIPILKKLSHTKNKTLQDLYLELLYGASSIDSCHNIHPSYINVIENLSPDEVYILSLINELDEINSIQIGYKHLRDYTQIRLDKELHSLISVRDKFAEMLGDSQDVRLLDKISQHKEYTKSVLLPRKFHFYTINLSRLGLIDINDKGYHDGIQAYEMISDVLMRFIEIPKNQIVQFHQRRIELTAYGKAFIEECKA